MEGIIARYGDLIWSLLPEGYGPIPQEHIITLGEGNTPLMRVKNLEAYLKTLNPRFEAHVYVKDEGKNPTMSFKDRGMTGAISRAKYTRKSAVACASTGNTLASAAAFAKKAGIPCYGLVPAGKVTPGKIFLASRYGAKIIQVRGNFDDAFNLVKKIRGVEMVNNTHPYRLPGQATVAFEICDELGLIYEEGKRARAPSFHFLPVGNAGNITAHWMGYKKYCQIGKIPFLQTRMIGCQAAGAAAMVLGCEIKNPETEASAIRIGKPARREEANAARKESFGRFDSVTDDEIKEARKILVELEDVFVELASAAPVAVLIRYAKFNRLHFWDTAIVVCTLTGSGWKDLDTAIPQFVPRDPIIIEPTLEAVMNVIRSK